MMVMQRWRVISGFNTITAGGLREFGEQLFLDRCLKLKLSKIYNSLHSLSIHLNLNQATQEYQDSPSNILLDIPCSSQATLCSNQVSPTNSNQVTLCSSQVSQTNYSPDIPCSNQATQCSLLRATQCNQVFKCSNQAILFSKGQAFQCKVAIPCQGNNRVSPCSNLVVSKSHQATQAHNLRDTVLQVDSLNKAFLVRDPDSNDSFITLTD